VALPDVELHLVDVIRLAVNLLPAAEAVGVEVVLDLPVWCVLVLRMQGVTLLSGGEVWPLHGPPAWAAAQSD
jgi:hypothetical protein